MLKTLLVALLPLVIIFSSGLDRSLTKPSQKGREVNSGTLEKLMVATGDVAIDLNLSRLNGTKGSKTGTLRFTTEANSFFTVIVFNDELRGPLPSSMRLIPQNSASLPAKLNASLNDLEFEATPIGSPYELVVRDGKTGFVFFNVEGHQFDYVPAEHALNVQLGRLLISTEFASAMGRPNDDGVLIGQISVNSTLRQVEVTEVFEGEAQTASLPGRSAELGGVPGPDVIVGDLIGLQQFGGSSGGQVGLAVGTDSCNAGQIDLNWFANPSNDHPVIPQNLYRMSGGATNDERFEQVGQSSVKHAFTALTQNICGFGCNGVGGTRLGSGCSDPYSASLNSGPSLGSRAWINPFTGAFPRNEGATPNNNHSGHVHTGPSHRILTAIADLSTSVNVGATYYAEGQYITPHEYVWCQANPGQCNMNNNVSYRRYNVNGAGSPFTFTPSGATVRTKPALIAWTGSTQVEIRPDPANDGIGTVAYKVTNPSPGVWHYEYAIYNQNLDRGIQSFSVPVGGGVTLSNVGFHAPPQHPGWTLDGTAASAGYSSAPWVGTEAGGAITWNSETFSFNQNANALRWGTLYNFRFDSNRPPQTMNATVGFYKTGDPITVPVQGPAPAAAANVSVSGRVTSAGGQGIKSVYVFMLDAGGVTRTAVSNAFGYYQFDNVLTGTYTVGVSSKRHSFPEPTVIPINDNISNLNFVAEP